MSIDSFDTGLGAFVRSMRLHDIAKPFFPGREKHAAAGFLLLSRAGKDTESLYALFHHEPNPSTALGLLASWRKANDGDEIPVWIALAPFIDRLAASGDPGAERDPKKGTGIYSFENPFSRLPEVSEIPSYGKSDKLEEDVSKALWNRFPEKFIEYESFKEVLGKVSADPSEAVSFFRKNAGGDQAVAEHWVENVMRGPIHLFFRERTYPTANDTSLGEHGRLCAALALVAGGNLVLGQHPLKRVWIKGPESARKLFVDDREVDQKGLASEVFTIRDFARNTGCILVRIAFTLVERLFTNAIRLDDVHGAVKTAEMLKEKFRKTFQARICSLIDPSLQGDDLEPLNDFPYDLVYLLPAGLSGRIRDAIDASYAEAADSVACKLKHSYDEDFHALFAKKLPLTDDLMIDGQDLSRRLSSLCPEPAMQAVSPDQIPMDGSGFGRFKKAYSNALREAYRKIWEDYPLRLDPGEAQSAWDSGRKHAGAEICDVCGMHPAFSGFYQFYEKAGAVEKELMEKVMYGHKEQDERLCCMCRCIRCLSHQTVQAGWLNNMMGPAGDKAVRKPVIPGGMKPPPAMPASVELDRKDPSIPVNMGACFVRIKNGRFNVYPAINAVADADSNVALIQLEPDSRIVRGELGWQRALDRLIDCEFHFKGIGEGLSAVHAAEGIHPGLAEMDPARFCNAYAAQCRRIREKSPECEAAAVYAFPHLARVLTRIRWIDQFFEQLPERIEGQVRVLTLEARYPRLVLLVPADSLTLALHILHRHAAGRLFSSTLYDFPPDMPGHWKDAWAHACLDALNVLLPRVLCGAVVVFKARQPFYHVLLSARQVVNFIIKEQSPGAGIHFGFTDLRGGLGALHESTPPPIVNLDFSELFRVISADHPSLSRRHVLALKDIQGAGIKPGSDYFKANLHLMRKRHHWPEELPEALSDKGLFNGLAFLKTVTKDQNTHE